MTKQEYLQSLRAELEKRHVGDVEEILSEYEQHFAFKLSDGYGEEEIAARLESPKAIAGQFDAAAPQKASKGGKALLKAALCVCAVFEVLLLIVLFAWVLVLAAGAIATLACGVCLITGLQLSFVAIPFMPAAGSLLFGISMLAFALLFALGAVYCTAYVKQLVRVSARWHKNTLSDHPLPPLPLQPQFSGKTKRRLRTVTLWTAMVFGVATVAAFVVLAFMAGSLEFWHVWNWFV